MKIFSCEVLSIFSSHLNLQLLMQSFFGFMLLAATFLPLLLTYSSPASWALFRLFLCHSMLLIDLFLVSFFLILTSFSTESKRSFMHSWTSSSIFWSLKMSLTRSLTSENDGLSENMRLQSLVWSITAISMSTICSSSSSSLSSILKKKEFDSQLNGLIFAIFSWKCIFLKKVR